MASPRRGRWARGVAAIEFGVTLPFLLFLMMGIVELSLLMHRNYIVSRAARDACRIGSAVVEGVNPTGDEIEAAAVAHALFALDAADVDCDALDCVVVADWRRESGWWVLNVRVSVPYTPTTTLFPLVPDATAFQFTMLTQQQVTGT